MELIVDAVKHTVLFETNKISNLTRREFQLLWKLCQDPGRVYSREQLYEEVWNEKAKPEDRTIDVHIAQIRKKIDKLLIKSIKGVGYKINYDGHQVKLVSS